MQPQIAVTSPMLHPVGTTHATGFTSQSSFQSPCLPHPPFGTLRVLSFNIWGIFNSKYRHQRLSHFAATKLKDFDIICLQEQFDEADFTEVIWNHIPPAVRCQFHYKRYPSSFIGSGLTILSKYEIVFSQFLCYPTQGYAEKVYHGDFFANKGVSLCRVRVPCDNSGPGQFVDVNVYNTHLVAQYEKYSKLGSYEKETYAPFRMSQAATLANFICGTSRLGDNIILCGDFNASPSSPEMKLVLGVCQQRAGIEFARTLIDDDATNFTYSYDNQFNSDSTTYLKFMDMQEDIPVQLDHILFHGRNLQVVPLALPNTADVSPLFQMHNRETAMGAVVFTNNKEVVTGDAKCPTCPLSDHFGVAAKFALVAMLPGGSPAGGLGRSSAFEVINQSAFSYQPPPRVPQLSVDCGGHKKNIEIGASFLMRTATKLRIQSVFMFRVALALIAVPCLVALMSAWLLKNESANDQHQSLLAGALQFVSHATTNSVSTFLFGFASATLIVLAKVHRTNDSVVMNNQAEELRSVLHVAGHTSPPITDL